MSHAHSNGTLAAYYIHLIIHVDMYSCYLNSCDFGSDVCSAFVSEITV